VSVGVRAKSLVAVPPALMVTLLLAGLKLVALTETV